MPRGGGEPQCRDMTNFTELVSIPPKVRSGHALVSPELRIDDLAGLSTESTGPVRAMPWLASRIQSWEASRSAGGPGLSSMVCSQFANMLICRCRYAFLTRRLPGS